MQGEFAPQADLKAVFVELQLHVQYQAWPPRYFRGTEVSLFPAKCPLYLELKRQVSFLLSVGAVFRGIHKL